MRVIMFSNEILMEAGKEEGTARLSALTRVRVVMEVVVCRDEVCSEVEKDWTWMELEMEVLSISFF